MTDEIAKLIYNHPERIGIAAGFKDLKSIHGEWIREMVFGDGDYTLLAHRGGYKSSCLAVAIGLLMVFQPTDNIIFLRKADNDVVEMINMVKKVLSLQIMSDICFLAHGVPLEVLKSAQDNISTNIWKSPMGAPQLLGIGLKSSITGKHAPIVITDDICNVNDRASRAEREKTKLQYQELQNIRNPGGRIINLGTRWHKDDVFTLMDNIHVYDYKTTGILSEEKLEHLRKSMTAALFACNYELKIIADDDIIFMSPVVGADPATVLNGIMHVDSAFYGEDYTAWSIMTKHDGKYYLYGRMKRKHVEDCYPEIKADYDRFLCGKLYTEDNADKGFVAKELRKLGMKVATYTETQNKAMKITTFLKKAWPDLSFVEGTDEDYISQICDYNEGADHDDAPDSAACLARLLLNKANNEGYRSIYGGLY